MGDEKCNACIHVIDAVRPVLYVLRDDDGDLILACGNDDHRQSAEDWKVVHRGHLLELDAGLAAIVDLHGGQKAERTGVEQPWIRGPHKD